MTDAPPPKSDLVGRVCFFFGTGCFISLAPAAIIASFKSGRRGQMLLEKKWTGAGLFGSLEGALTYILLPMSFTNNWAVLLLAVGASVFVSGRAEKFLNSHDDSRIVIDEWVGAWIACVGLQPRLSPLLIMAVILFRFFDVLKGPIGRRVQDLSSGWGIVADDVYAGVAANICWRIGLFLFMTVAH